MDAAIAPYSNARREPVLAAVVALHLLAVVAWLSHPPPAGQQGPDPDEMDLVWVRPSPLPAPAAAPPALRPRPPVRPPSPASSVPPPLAAATIAPSMAIPAPASQPPALAAPAAPVLSPDELFEHARRSAGAIAREVRKGRRPVIVLPPDSPAIRLRAGIEHAAEMAPRRWFEAPKIRELVDNTGNARRTRVITGNGTYCITQDKVHAPSGIDTMQRGIKEKITNCPANEEPAKPQQWVTAAD